MKETEKDIKAVEKVLKNTEKAIKDLPRSLEEERIIVEKSQFVDVNNIIQGNVISQNNEQARHEARYRSTRLGIPFNESQTSSEEANKITDEMADRFLRDYIKKIFK